MTQKRKGLHERHATAPLSPIETGVLDELRCWRPRQPIRLIARESRTWMTRRRLRHQLRHPAYGDRVRSSEDPHAGRVVMPAAKPGAKILRGSVVGDLRATLEETRSLLSDRDEQLRKARLREAELMTALESERQCVRVPSAELSHWSALWELRILRACFQFQLTSTRGSLEAVHRSLRRRLMSTLMRRA